MSTRPKSVMRNIASRMLASSGFAFYNMSFGTADIAGFAVPNKPNIEAEVRVTE